MPITDNMRMQIIMAYPNAPILYRGAPHSIIEIHLPDNELILKSKDNGIDWYKVSQLHIGLRPISSLTDEECIEVARIFGFSNIPNYRYYVMKILSSENGSEGYSRAHKWHTEVTDYLRSINIITTVHGIDLVKEGIAILDDKTTNP